MTTYDPFAPKKVGAESGLLETIAAGVANDVISKLPAPIVNVAPTQVSVQAPHVTVTPNIIVEDHDEAPVINVDVEVPGLVEMAAGLAAVHADLQAIISLLQRPVVKRVERSQGLISQVTETR